MHVYKNPSKSFLENYYKSLNLHYKTQYEEKRKKIVTLNQWSEFKKEYLNIIRNSFPDEIYKKRDTLKIEKVSQHEFDDFRIENILFESVEGWYVNATVYLPKKPGRYPAIVCPTGHSSKTMPNYVISNQVLARNGYITVSFDPPGMRGEHQIGNDHFNDGVLGFLSGIWSNTLFVYDAISCIDYLETRDDVIKENGYGITGVSGGGHTSLITSLIDDRISCLAPVCCVSDNTKIIFEDFYTLCPEVLAYGFLKYQIDYKLLIELNAPKPCLIISGKKDEVFDVDLAAKTVEEAKKAYGFYGKEEKLNHFTDNESGHAYTVKMANKASEFFSIHLKNKAEKSVKITENDIYLPEREMLLCNPPDKTSMYTMNLKKLSNIKAKADAKSVSAIFNLRNEKVSVLEDKGILRWVHLLKKRIYEFEDGYQVPALVLERQFHKSEDVLFFCDDQGKWKGFENNSFLTKTSGFLSREKVENEKTIVSIDLSGFGELKPEPDAYDLADWNKKIRILTYASLFLGDSILGKRVREFYNILNSCEDNMGIYTGGRGKAAISVLIGSYLFGNANRVYLIDMPVSFKTIAEYVPNQYLPDIVFHNAPDAFEIYEMTSQLKNAVLINPRLGNGEKAGMSLCNKLFKDTEIIYSEDNEYEFL